ncbi:hypothetical protein [uncultured Aeromicrobium sp.]|uniref:hypothetical protein n=1 Tax=uncultured Aeromicrobium sp. TaxID=337820 RepID=UPI0025FECB15|nr:hypothetical protein [uncultured Aeromicrobium sp.]
MTSPIVSPGGDADVPPPGEATVEAVQAWLGPMDEDAEVLADTVAAVNSLIVAWRGPRPETGWPAHVVRGLNMLAARLIRRRNSPAGVEAAGELGPLYVQRNDPDVAMLLGLGTYTRPAVG